MIWLCSAHHDEVVDESECLGVRLALLAAGLLLGCLAEHVQQADRRPRGAVCRGCGGRQKLLQLLLLLSLLLLLQLSLLMILLLMQLLKLCRHVPLSMCPALRECELCRHSGGPHQTHRSHQQAETATVGHL